MQSNQMCVGLGEEGTISTWLCRLFS